MDNKVVLRRFRLGEPRVKKVIRYIANRQECRYLNFAIRWHDHATAIDRHSVHLGHAHRLDWAAGVGFAKVRVLQRDEPDRDGMPRGDALRLDLHGRAFWPGDERRCASPYRAGCHTARRGP